MGTDPEVAPSVIQEAKQDIIRWTFSDGDGLQPAVSKTRQLPVGCGKPERPGRVLVEMNDVTGRALVLVIRGYFAVTHMKEPFVGHHPEATVPIHGHVLNTGNAGEPIQR